MRAHRGSDRSPNRPLRTSKTAPSGRSRAGGDRPRQPSGPRGSRNRRGCRAARGTADEPRPAGVRDRPLRRTGPPVQRVRETKTSNVGLVRLSGVPPTRRASSRAPPRTPSASRREARTRSPAGAATRSPSSSNTARPRTTRYSSSPASGSDSSGSLMIRSPGLRAVPLTPRRAAEVVPDRSSCRARRSPLRSLPVARLLARHPSPLMS